MTSAEQRGQKRKYSAADLAGPATANALALLGGGGGAVTATHRASSRGGECDNNPATPAPG